MDGIRVAIDMSSVNKVKQQHKDLIKELTDYTNNNPIKFKFDDTVKQFKGLDEGFKQVTESNNNFSTSMGHAIKRVGEYALAIGGIYGAIQQVKEGFETFSEIDTKISNISMITGMDKGQLQEQSKLWNKVAVDMKTTTGAIADSAEEWLRSGKSIDESNERLKVSIALAKLSGESISDVTQKQIKIGNAYEHTTKQAEEFANKITYLDTQTSTSTGALLKSANGVAEIGKQAKVTEDYLLSSIATIQERSGKAPEAVARAIRGILQDLTKVTKATDEEGQKALSKFEAIMVKQGLAIRKSATEFKSGEEIIKSMASKWKDFDDVTKRTIQQLAGGKTFSEEFNILMNEQNRVLDLNNQLKDAGASLQDKYAKATDNVKDSTQQLKAKMEGLWLGLLNSNGLQNAIGEVGHLVDVLKYLTIESPRTGLAFAAMTGTVIFAIKNFTAFTKVLEGTVFFFKMLPLALTTSGGLVELLTIQFKRLTAVLTTLTTTPAGAAFMALTSAVAVASTVIGEHVKYQEELAEKTKQTKQVVEDLDKAMQSLNKQQISLNLDKMNEDFKKLDELKKKKEDLEKRMNEWTLNPKEIAKRVLPINAFELSDLNKEIEKLETAMKNGGETTEKYAEANERLLQMKVADTVKEQCQEEIKNTEALKQMKDAVVPLWEEYNNLNNVKEKDSIQTARMSELATQLKEKIGANTVAIDENGNVILENNDLIGQNVKMLKTEGVTIESLTQLRLDMMKQNATVQANMTTDTYNNVMTRVKLMKSEFDAVGGQAEELRAKWKDGAISDEDRKQLESMDRYLMSRGSSIGNFNNALAEVDKIYSVSKKGNYDTPDVSANHIPTDLGEKEKRDKKELENLRLRIEGTRELSEKIALVDAQLSKINSMKDTVNEKDKAELTKQQIELLRQKSQILDESFKKQQEEIQASRKLLESQGFKFNSQGLIENEEKLIELQNYANSVHGEERERQQAHVKNLKSEIDNVYYKLLNSTSQNRVQWQQLQTEAEKAKMETIETELKMRDMSVNNISEKAKDLKHELAMIGTSTDQDKELNNIKKKAEITKQIIDNAQREKQEYADILTYLRSQLALQQTGSKEWDEINSKINTYKDKLRSSTEEINSQIIAMRELLVDVLSKVAEKDLFDGKTEKEYEDIINAQSEAIDKQIEALEKQWEAEKLATERKEKLAELDKLRQQNQAFELNNLAQMSEEEAKKLELEEAREKVLEHNKELKEMELKLENLQKNKNIRELTKDQNGRWNFEYVANEKEIKKTQDDIKKKQDDFNKWHKKESEKIKDSLKKKQEEYNKWELEQNRQQQIKLLKDKQKAFQDDLKLRKKHFEKIKEMFKKEVDEKDPNSLMAMVKDAYEIVKKSTKEMTDKVSMTVKDGLVKEDNPDSVKTINKDGWKEILEIIKQKYEELIQATTDTTNKVIAMFRSMVEQVKAAIQEMNSAIAGLNPSTSISISGGMGGIKTFDTGGMTVGEGLAYLHDKEIVLNRPDTENILKAVKMANISQSVFENMSKLNNKVGQSQVVNSGTTIKVEKVVLELPNIRDNESVEKTVKVLENSFKELNTRTIQMSKNKI